MRSTRRLLVALVAGVIAAGLFIVLLTQAYNTKNQANTGGNGAGAGPQVNVVVAVPAPGFSSLPAGTKLTQQTMKLAPIPESQYSLNPTSYLKSTAQALNQYISVSLPAGAPILGSFLIAEAPSQNNTLSRAPLPIDAGFEAMGIPYDPNKDVAGYIQPGDHLDILVTWPDGTVHYGFQNVLVLRVAPGASATAIGQLVVEMTPQKVASLTYLLANQPSTLIRIAERPVSTTGNLGAKPVNGNNWIQPGFSDS